MNGRTIVAAVAAAITSFLLGWLFYGLLLMDFFSEHSTHYEGLMKEMPNLALIFIANLLTGYFFAFIYQQWAGIRTFGKGFIYGLLLGFLISLAYDLYFLAGMNLYSGTLIVVDVVVGTVMTGISAGVVGLVLGYGKKANT